MTTLALTGALVALTAITTSAQAQAQRSDGDVDTSADAAVYVSADAGYAWSGDTGFTPPFPSTNDATVNFTDGHEIAGALGYDFGGLRIEGEIAHRNISLDGAIGSQGNPYGFAGFEFESVGSVKTTTYMLNVYGDFPMGDRIEFFAGAGVGQADSDLYVRNLPFEDPYFDSSDTNLAWQLTAGGRVRIADSFALRVRYKYLRVEDSAFPDFSNSDYTGSFGNQSLLAGVELRF